MTEKSGGTISKFEVDANESVQNSTSTRRKIYPEANEKVKGLVVWLGLVFVVLVVLLQQFSGYL